MLTLLKLKECFFCQVKLDYIDLNDPLLVFIFTC